MEFLEWLDIVYWWINNGSLVLFSGIKTYSFNRFLLSMTLPNYIKKFVLLEVYGLNIEISLMNLLGNSWGLSRCFLWLWFHCMSQFLETFILQVLNMFYVVNFRIYLTNILDCNWFLMTRVCKFGFWLGFAGFWSWLIWLFWSWFIWVLDIFILHFLDEITGINFWINLGQLWFWWRWFLPLDVLNFCLMFHSNRL